LKQQSGETKVRNTDQKEKETLSEEHVSKLLENQTKRTKSQSDLGETSGLGFTHHPRLPQYPKGQKGKTKT
jgi:hypothetical protein